MRKNRFNVSDEANQSQAFITNNKSNDYQLFKNDLKRQNVFWPKLKDCKSKQ